MEAKEVPKNTYDKYLEYFPPLKKEGDKKMKALLRLFRAVKVDSKGEKGSSESVLARTLRSGFIFSPEVVYNHTEEELLALAEVIENEIGLTPEQMNSSFHKSWQKVSEASIEQLFLEQIVHYFTTYGFEFLGVYDENSVYIPSEMLEIPDIDMGDINIVVIRGYEKEEIKAKLMDLLASGVALHEDTIKDVVDVAKDVGIGREDLDDIKNKEVKIALCNHLGMVPRDPIEFLRYVIFEITGKTLIIKDPATIEGIKESDRLNKAYDFFKLYQSECGLEKLAEVFYRFKPLLLAFKAAKPMRPIINKIRKLAHKYHKPMREDYLNEITSLIKNEGAIDKERLERCLEKVNPFRKIRLAYALKYRTNDVDSILYKIRNGKAFASDFSFENKELAGNVLAVVLESLTEDMKKNVAGKKIYIPSNVEYALPATEKQFTGNFPSGTCVRVPGDMIFGVHWNNTEGKRIDLDLSLINVEEGKIGWDSSYRTGDRRILFSGDMTDARGKKGASELFYVKSSRNEEFLAFINYYNYSADVEVPFRILVARERVNDFGQNYMVNPNNIKAVTETKINVKQKILGLLVTTADERRFYFSECAIGRSITSSGNDYAENCRKYLSRFYQNMISLNLLLASAGAEMVEERNGCDVDLSPESLEKDTIIRLLKS